MANIKKSNLTLSKILFNFDQAYHVLLSLKIHGTQLLSKDDLWVLNEIRALYPSVDVDIHYSAADDILHRVMTSFQSSFDKEPKKILVNGKYIWVFKDYEYEVKGHYSDEQVRLLILEDFDKERKYFEKLKIKFPRRRL